MAIVRRQDAARSTATDSVRSGLSIGELVSRVREAGLFRIPLDVDAVAEMLGVEVSREVMEDDISGYLEFRSGQWIAGVNALHHRNRQRFTMAHEIAHFCLHRHAEPRFVDQTFARRSGMSDPMEIEADRFAAELLIPTEELKAFISSGVTSLQDLAEAFGVSTLAMRFRVKSLGYGVK